VAINVSENLSVDKFPSHHVGIAGVYGIDRATDRLHGFTKWIGEQISYATDYASYRLTLFKK